MTRLLGVLVALAILLIGPLPASAQVAAAPDAIPFSAFGSPEARAAWESERAKRINPTMPKALAEKAARRNQMSPEARLEYYRELRAWVNEFVAGPLLAKQQADYKVDIAPASIGGVYTETFTPADGVTPGNADRVLINLHGGSLTVGARIVGQIESIPIAAVGRIKVISIDYRMAPEYRFPAAVDDVLAVYRELLKTYKPSNIGIYGCSAGGTLTAQAVAAMVANQLPRPGAIGMFCGTGEVWAKGDSAYFWALLNGLPLAAAEHDPSNYEYLRGVDLSNPLIFPMRHPELLRGFPPSLLISGTRSHEMSTMIDAHNKLIAAGVDARLHLWDGVMHASIYDPSLPESREAYDVITRFFAEKLGPYYRAELARFLAADLAQPPARCGILFTGSSSIRLWTSLVDDMAPATVINRGFGGATIAEINELFDRVITPYRPKAIFFYAGENDLSANQLQPGDVLAAFQRFIALKRANLGKIPVYFISIKPSKLRWGDWARQRETNRLIERYASKQSDVRFVDVATAMIHGGSVRDVFRADQLHMTPAGYQIWTSVLRPLVQREAERAAPGCAATPAPAP